MDQIWQRLGIGAAIRRVAAGRRLDTEQVERVLFALVAQRALEPGSKLAATSWVTERVAIEGCTGFSSDAAYAGMDFLLQALDEVASEIFAAAAHLLNLDLDIVFVDSPANRRLVNPSDRRITVNRSQSTPDLNAFEERHDWPVNRDTDHRTYWQTEGPDALPELQDDEQGGDRDEASPLELGQRQFGHSKDHREDLPQVVIAMAVTRDGVPIRCWTFPGSENDQAIIRTVKDDLG